MKRESKVLIKGMVCGRCIDAVRQVFLDEGYDPVRVSLGEVTVVSAAGATLRPGVVRRLAGLGFELLQDRNAALVAEVRALVSEVYSGDFDFPYRFRFSDLVQGRMHRDYDGVSARFLAIEGSTIEQYIINYRVEKIKELLVYTDAPLSDISFRLNYSSAAYLSRQFRQVTGLTPSWFRALRKDKSAGSLAS